MHFKMGRVGNHGQLGRLASSAEGCSSGTREVLFDFGACFLYSSWKKQLSGFRSCTESACERRWVWEPPRDVLLGTVWLGVGTLNILLTMSLFPKYKEIAA